MEALTAVTTACLTVYDMLKAAQKSMEIRTSACCARMAASPAPTRRRDDLVAEALERVLALANPPRPEIVSLADAHGRALLQPAVSRLTQPPFDASAMDGYAMRAADLDDALTVIGTSAAGHPWGGTARRAPPSASSPAHRSRKALTMSNCRRT